MLKSLHWSLRNGHIETVQNDVWVLLRTVLFVCSTHANGLLSSCGHRWRLWHELPTFGRHIVLLMRNFVNHVHRYLEDKNKSYVKIQIPPNQVFLVHMYAALKSHISIYVHIYVMLSIFFFFLVCLQDGVNFCFCDRAVFAQTCLYYTNARAPSHCRNFMGQIMTIVLNV